MPATVTELYAADRRPGQGYTDYPVTSTWLLPGEPMALGADRTAEVLTINIAGERYPRLVLSGRARRRWGLFQRRRPKVVRPEKGHWHYVQAHDLMICWRATVIDGSGRPAKYLVEICDMRGPGRAS